MHHTSYHHPIFSIQLSSLAVRLASLALPSWTRVDFVKYPILVPCQTHDPFKMNEANGIQNLNDSFVSLAV